MKLDHLLYEDGPGGGPKTVLNHITYYARTYNIRLLHGGSGMLAEKCDQLGIARQKIPLDRLWKTPFGFFVLWFALIANKPDILLLHGQWSAFFGAVAGRLAGVSTIVYICQWPSFYTDWDLWRVFRNFILEDVPCRLCDAVVAISPGNRNEFLRRYPGLGSRLYFIPNSIDLTSVPKPEDAAKLRQDMGWPDDACHVLCVGRLSSQKRVDWLLQAWKIVEAHNDGACLWLIGSGEEEPALRYLAQELGLARCVFLGPKKAAWKYMAAADIIAMPSMYEGHANIPLEAMAAGRPIVACAVDGVRETFEHNIHGMLVPPGDPQAMAGSLLELIAAPDRRVQMGCAGLEHVKTYEKGRMLRRFLDLFEKLVKNKTSASLLSL